MKPSARRQRDLIIPVRPVDVRRVLVAVIVLLTLCHFLFAVPQTPVSRLFDLDLEGGIGTWVSSALLTLAAALAFLLAALVRPERRAFGLATFAAIVLALSVEEVASFHESASLRVATAAQVGGTYSGGTPLIGLALFPFAAAGLVLLARRMSEHAKAQVLLGGVVWYSATFATEQLDAWNLDGALGSPDPELIHRLIAGVQEGGEMLGAALVICGLFLELAAVGREATLRVCLPEGDDSGR